MKAVKSFQHRAIIFERRQAVVEVHRLLDAVVGRPGLDAELFEECHHADLYYRLARAARLHRMAPWAAMDVETRYDAGRKSSRATGVVHASLAGGVQPRF